MHDDDAFDFLVHHLTALREAKDFRGQRAGPRDCDLYLPDLVWTYWLPQLDRSGGRYSNASELEQERFLPFYDAAWELCRIGVLRPGELAPRGMSHPKMFGDNYVVTRFGRVWLQEAKQRPFINPSRLADLLASFASRFGDGFGQRSSEAVKTYRTANWLAACVMAGAAAESILLALAIAKTGDERAVFATYNGAKGRARTTQLVIHGTTAGVQTQFANALQILHFWRDDAAHGMATTISEIEAYASLMQLLRLCQFADDQWVALTT